MIKVKGKHENLNTLAGIHLNALIDGKNGFVSPKKNLEDWLKDGSLTNKSEIELVEWIIEDFDKIVTADITTLKSYISERGVIGKDYRVKGNPFYKNLKKKLRYENFRKNHRAIDFVKSFDLKACPYCNAQYLLTISKSGKALCHFDHILSKDKYPYLCVSFFNLVPCCSNCNLMKSNKDVFANHSFVHPYYDSIADKFQFHASNTAIKNFHTNGRTIRADENIELIIKKGERIDFHLETFKFQEIYNEHHDFIDEAYLKAIMYNSSRYEELYANYVESNQMTEEELDRLVYGNYMESGDINKRPLAKLQQDLITQFKKFEFD